MLLALCILLFGLLRSQTIDEIDTANVISVNLTFEGDSAFIVMSSADNSESSLLIEPFDHIHSILSDVCPRVPITDCVSTMDVISLKFYNRYYTPSLPQAKEEDFNGTRVDIIRYIAENYPVVDYLEIGAANSDAFIVAQELFPNAVGVDPVEGCTHRMTSDEFFANNTAKFDVIFVDGLHTAIQVYKDIHNALKILKPGGIVLMHDCNPRSFHIQDKVPAYEGALWSGDVWKAAVALRLRQDVEIVVVDVDYGVGVIRKRRNRHRLPAEWIKYLDVNPFNVLSYGYYDKHRYTLHRFMTMAEMRQWLAETV